MISYSLESNLTIGMMRAVLNQLGRWRFAERDCDDWGEYMSSATGRPGVASVTILEDGISLTLPIQYGENFEYRSDYITAAEDFEIFVQEFFEEMLPAIGAQNIHFHDHYERVGFP